MQGGRSRRETQEERRGSDLKGNEVGTGRRCSGERPARGRRQTVSRHPLLFSFLLLLFFFDVEGTYEYDAPTIRKMNQRKEKGER